MPYATTVTQGSPPHADTLSAHKGKSDERRPVWVGCRDAGGEAGRLLVAALDGLRTAVPGLADVLGERLAAAVEPVDMRAATDALVAEVERLLVEPLVLVFDDAEELVG